MNARLRLTAKNGEIKLTDLEAFYKVVVTRKLDMRQVASYEIDGEELVISLPLPKDEVALSGGKRKIRIKPRNVHQQKIDAQLAEHREKKKSGEAEGYVPPVGRKGPPAPRKTPCTVCGTRKPVVTVAGIKTIKPHIVQGEKCSGSGVQVGVKKKSRAKEKK